MNDRNAFNCYYKSITIVFFIIVLCYIAGIVVFPVGWDAKGVRSVCGDGADVYSIGNCSIGWAYIIVIIGTGVGVAAVCMSWTPLIKRKTDEDSPYAI